MNENIKELIESLPNKGIDCKGREWVRYKPTSNKLIDRTGETYGRLTALFPIREKGKIRTKWLCQCSCSNFIVVTGYNLETKDTQSCGCLRAELSAHKNDKEREKIIGERFGRLTVLSFEGVYNKKAIFKCRCDCGNEIIVRGADLKSGNTTSCGCLQKKVTSHMNDKYRQEMIGKNFGFLKVLSFDKIQNRRAYYTCFCELCGSITVKLGYDLLSGNTKSCGCMKESYGESKITKILEEAKIPYKKQQAFDDLRSDSKKLLRYDFAIMNENNEITRLIEFDGEQHFRVNEHFGGEEEFTRRQYLDNLKNQYAISHNIPLVRIPYTEQDNLTLDLLFDDKYTIKELQE